MLTGGVVNSYSAGVVTHNRRLDWLRNAIFSQAIVQRPEPNPRRRANAKSQPGHVPAGLVEARQAQ
jgi:hypothetical protein